MKKCSLLLIYLLLLGMFTAAGEENNYYMLDISSAANSKVYLDNDEEPGANVTWSEASPSGNDFMIFKNDSSRRFAIQTSSLEQLLTDGILTDKQGVPYSVGTDNVIGLRSTSTPSVTYDIADGYYENLYFLYADIGGIASGVEIRIDYADNTYDVIDNLQFENSYLSSASSDSENTAGVAARYNCYKEGQDFRLLQYVGIYRHEIPVNSDKTVTAVKFTTASDYELKILAITAKTVSLDKIAGMVQEKLNNLSEDKTYLNELKAELDNLAALGYDVKTLDNYSEFLSMYEDFAAEKRYVTADISKAANSKLFMDSSPTPGMAIPWNDFVTSDLDGCNWDGQSEHRMGIQTSSIEKLLTNGKFINTDGVIYDMPLGRVITVIQSSPKKELDMTNRAYNSIHLLATAQGTVPLTVTVTYTDGSTQTDELSIAYAYNATVKDNMVMAPNMYVAWSKSAFTCTSRFGISEYSIDTDNTKEVDKITFECMNANGVKIVAITGQEAKNSLIKSALQQSILNLKTNGKYLFDIKATLELLESRGISTDDMEGLDVFYDALDKCVYVTGVSENTDFEKTDIRVEFLNPIKLNDEYISVTKDGKTFTDCELSCEEDKIIHIIFDNVMDYDSEYAITLSEQLSSKSGGLILGEEETYSITITPPIAFKNADVTGSKAKVQFAAELVSNMETSVSCKIIAAAYTEDGEMTDIRLISCTAMKNMPTDISVMLNGAETAEKLTVECRIVDSYENLEELYPVIIKEF